MIRRYFIAGLLLWVPLWVTWLVISFIFKLMDKTLSLLPVKYQPDHLLGFHIPGLGLVFTILIVFLTGILVTNFIGHRLVGIWERILARIPLVRSIYTAVKQVVHTLFSAGGESFRKVVLVEYPRPGVWSMGFQTGRGFREARQQIGHDLITIFIPTTPNPTSGFIVFVPKHSVIELNMNVDEGLKMVVSLGVAAPIEDVGGNIPVATP